MKLFDETQRDHMAPMENAEHPFTYLDRSSRPEAAKVRGFVERAFSYYPVDRQAELEARLRSEEHYRSGSFELILHELLRVRDLSLEIEVPKTGTAKRPDFLVGSGADSFYLEAILATEGSARTAESKRLGQLLDVVSRMQSDSFYIGFDVEATGPGQPSAKSIVDYLTYKTGGLDPDDESIWIGPDGFTRPAWVWQDQGWRIVFSPMPKKVSARGQRGRRAVGMVSEGPRAMNTDEAIRRAVRKKATRYGEMDRPYVVAVNVLTWPIDEVDCIEALFGSFDGTEYLPDGEERFLRKPDGVLRPGMNTRVSAVAFFEDVGPWTAAKRDAFVVHNRFAERPLPLGTLGIPDARAHGDTLERQGGKTLGELLGLSPGWPSE